MRIERSAPTRVRTSTTCASIDVLPVRAGDGDPVVPVAHEVGVADAVDLDRRERLSATPRERDALPARAHAP